MLQMWWLLGSVFGGIITGMSGQASVIVGMEHIAQVFKNLLELVSLPIIFLSIVSALTGMDNRRDAARIGVRVLKYTFL